MANAAEVIERAAREAEQLRLLIMAQDLKADGKTLDDLIEKLKAITAKP